MHGTSFLDCLNEQTEVFPIERRRILGASFGKHRMNQPRRALSQQQSLIADYMEVIREASDRADRAA
jgi:hypothetical protein